jgi:hypothetical protein
MSQRITVLGEPGQTIFACQLTIPPDLVTAYGNRIEFTEPGAPNQGVYVSDEDIDLDLQWVVFSGSVMPTGWFEGNLLEKNMTLTANNISISAVAKLNSVR